MATVTITIADEDGTVSLEVESNPPVQSFERDTPAQMLANAVLASVHEQLGETA